ASGRFDAKAGTVALRLLQSRQRIIRPIEIDLVLAPCGRRLLAAGSILRRARAAAALLLLLHAALRLRGRLRLRVRVELALELLLFGDERVALGLGLRLAELLVS